MKVLIIIVLAIAIFGGAGYATYKLFVQPQQALKLEKSLPPGPPPPDPTAPEFEKCVAIRKTGKTLQARDAFAAFIEQYPESTKGPEAKDILGNLNTIYLTPFPTPDKEIYIVKPGDVVDRVARHTKTTGEMLVRANGLKANSNKGIILQIGQKLAIPRLDLSLVISRKQDKVIVLNKGRFFKWYPILQWPPQLAKKTTAGGKAAPPQPRLEGKVSERMAWFSGGRVTYVDPNFSQATHWVQIAGIPHSTLHSILDEKGESRPPSGGIVLQPKAVEELATLLSKGDPVTLE